MVKFLSTIRAVIAFRLESKRFRFDDARFLRMHRRDDRNDSCITNAQREWSNVR